MLMSLFPGASLMKGWLGLPVKCEKGYALSKIVASRGLFWGSRYEYCFRYVTTEVQYGQCRGETGTTSGSQGCLAYLTIDASGAKYAGRSRRMPFECRALC